ncbi:MAG: hypothetical protein ABH889_02865 [Candidatus Portnoybacteria bacterium]
MTDIKDFVKKIKGIKVLSFIAFLVVMAVYVVDKTLGTAIWAVKLLWPFIIVAIVLGTVFTVWTWAKEEVKSFFGIDLVKKISLTFLLLVLYVIYFYICYVVIVPYLREVSGLKSVHVLMSVTFLQIFTIGVLYYLISSFWPQAGKIARGFWIISIIGPLTIAFFHPETRQSLINFITAKKTEIGVFQKSRPLSGYIDIPAGTGIYNSTIPIYKKEWIRQKSVSSETAIFWNSVSKTEFKIPDSGTLRPCNATGELDFKKQKRPTRVEYQIYPTQ